MHTLQPFPRIQISAYDLWKLLPYAYACARSILISYTKINLPIITDKPLDALNPLISSLLSLYADVSFCILLRIKPSPLASRVLMFSFSKKTAMFSPFSSIVYFRQSTVFLENQLMDLVRIMSIFPSRQSYIIRLNDSRLAVFVALIPSSAYTSTSSQSGLLLM